MSVKVSVVIPVHNPGEYIEDCIASLLRQSLPSSEFEAIFVNDGSTDRTPERLDRLAAEHSHMHVIHQEPSGWSGKPRNTGTDAARGDFVMFVDNDDWLGDEALERMYEYGIANEADVIVGKMAGKGRPVPLELFRKNRPHATPGNAPLIDSLTPHKMFRKAFLDRHNLRFMEGRRRLEDHVFVTEAYLLASNVAVLSDYLCYYHIKREDASNAGFQRFDPAGYFRNLREALDVVERHTEPGALRDKLYRRWLRNEMIERLRGKRLLNLDGDFRKDLFDQIRSVVMERFGPGVAAGLNPQQQAVTALVIADSLRDVEELAHLEAQVKPTGRLESLWWEHAVLRIGFTAEFRVDDGPLLFRTSDGEDRLDSLTDFGIDVPVSLTGGRVDLVVRERSTAAEFFQPVESTPERETSDDASYRYVLHAKASVDPETAANGQPLTAGIWDVVIRITAAGWTKETRLGSVRADAAEETRRASLTGSPRRLVLPYWTEGPGNLSLDVDHATSKFNRDVRGITHRNVIVTPGRLEMVVPLVIAESEAVRVRYKAPLDGSATDVDASLTPDGETSSLSAALPVDQLAGRQVRIELGLPSAKRGAPRWTVLPVALDVAEDGSVTVTSTDAVNAVAKAAKEARAAAAKTARKPGKRPLLRRLAGRVKRAVTK